jgi:DNA primase
MELGKIDDLDILRSKLYSLEYARNVVDEILSEFTSSQHTIVIPIKDIYGYYESFALRTVDDSTKPKYLYLKGYERGKHFFNFCLAKHFDDLIIVEGYLDALIANSHGIKNVVACGGNFPTEEQLVSAFKYKKYRSIYLALDQDIAGINGTVKAIDKLREYNINLFVLNYDYKDPDELIRYAGIDSLKTSIENASNALKWMCRYIVCRNIRQAQIAGLKMP